MHCNCYTAFLALEEMEQQPTLWSRNTTKALSGMQAQKDIQSIFRKYNLLLTKSPLQNQTHYHEKYYFSALKDREELKQSNRQYTLSLQEMSDALDRYYWIDKLRIACDMTSRQAIIKGEYHCHFLQPVLEYIEKGNVDDLPCIEVYLAALQMLRTGEMSFFQQLKKLLNKHVALFAHDEAWTLYNYALNFCIRKINSGQSDFYNEIFLLYKDMLVKKIIFVNGHLSQWDFKNITTVALRTENLRWAEQFVQDYQRHLPPAERTNAVAYNMASIYFARNAYRDAVFQLQDVEFTDPSYYLGAKIIQLKSYYELNESEAYYSLIDAFRHYVRRNPQLSEYKRKANLNMLKFAKHMFQLRERRQLDAKSVFKQKCQALAAKIENTEPVANKQWLMDIVLLGG